MITDFGELNVGSLMPSQWQILEKTNEMFGKLNSRNSPWEAVREEQEHSDATPHYLGQSGNTMGSLKGNGQ